MGEKTKSTALESVLSSTCNAVERNFEIKDIDGAPFIVAPNDYKVHNMDRYLKTPQRKKGTTHVHDAKSFIEYVNTHKGGGSATFIDYDDLLFTTILNHHHHDEPDYGDHRCRFQLKYGAHYLRWKRNQRGWTSQIDFAEFLEDHKLDIATPDGKDDTNNVLFTNQLIASIQDLTDVKNVEFSQKCSRSGEITRLTYIEEESGKHEISYPQNVTLGLAVFNNSDIYKINIRLMHRIRNRELQFRYVMDQLEEIEDHAISTIAQSITDGTKIRTYKGEVE